jgi:hypothetical protein
MRRVVLMFVLITVASLVAAGVALAATERFRANLSGSQEVPAVTTTATGLANFTKVSSTKMTYTLTASDIDNVRAAHIHLAPRGQEGEIVVNFRVSTLCTVEPTSMSCQGTITAAQLTGPLAGRPLSALVRAMREGRTYVNVHTTAFPDGEIRGQIRALSTS